MSTHIALLRGINLAGKNMIAMADLRALLEPLGFTGVKTLLQSGNVVFDGGRKSGASLERLLESETEKNLGVAVDYHVRTAAEWCSIIAKNPFPAEAKRDPAHLVVLLMKKAPESKNVKTLQAAIRGPEYLEVDGRQGYVVYPAGIGNSKLTSAVMDRILGVRGTARNWNTVLKLGALVKQL
jgi:uncharacterized protein (DUF1697 family)